MKSVKKILLAKFSIYRHVVLTLIISFALFPPTRSSFLLHIKLVLMFLYTPGGASVHRETPISSFQNDRIKEHHSHFSSRHSSMKDLKTFKFWQHKGTYSSCANNALQVLGKAQDKDQRQPQVPENASVLLFNDVGLYHTTLLLTKINVNLQAALVVMWGHNYKLIFLHLITPNQYRTSMMYCVKNSTGRKQALCKYAQQNMCWWNLSNCERWSSVLTI